MRMADWQPCEEPGDGIKAGLVWLCEHVVATEDDIEGVVEYYVHSSEQIAFVRTGSSWYCSRTDRWLDPNRREGERRSGPGPAFHEDRPNNLRVADRRDRVYQEDELRTFIARWGNGHG